MFTHILPEFVLLIHIWPQYLCLIQKRYIGVICYNSFIITNIIKYKYTYPYNYSYPILLINTYYNIFDFIGNECRVIYNIYLICIALNVLINSVFDNLLLDLLFNKRIYLITISLICYYYMILVIKIKNYIPIGSNRHKKYEIIKNCLDFVSSVALLYVY